ncbi:hypothetical protein FGB62_50g28 [Gracilaria domingensis]|nr:hypothetical protein FGB62_50g28 [Gracilaria domingensis]
MLHSRRFSVRALAACAPHEAGWLSWRNREISAEISLVPSVPVTRLIKLHLNRFKKANETIRPGLPPANDAISFVRKLIMTSNKVEVPGQVVWVLKESAKVRKDFHSKTPYSWEIASSVSSSRTEIEQLAREHSSSGSISLSYTAEAEVEIFSASATSEFSWTQSALTRAANESQSNETKTTTKTTKVGPIELDPGESVYIFQKELRFSSHSYDTTELLIQKSSTPPDLDEEVTMRIPVTEHHAAFIEKIDVHAYGGHVYSKDFMQVVGHENEENDNIQDINKGFGGNFVYLQPHWTTDPSEAADHIEVTIVDNFPDWASEKGLKDMAAEAGGDYRFIEAQNNGGSKKIVAAQLWNGELHRTPDGWDGYTTDLNEGRSGRYLYVVYKLAETSN